MYYIVTQGRKGMNLFLVDRTKIKDRWWSTSLADAIGFTKKEAADIQCAKLVYKNPQVATQKEPQHLNSENDSKTVNDDIHPFSSEGLGQE